MLGSADLEKTRSGAGPQPTPDPYIGGAPSGRERDRAERSAGFVVRAGRKEQGIGRAIGRVPAAKRDGPQAVDDDRLVRRVAQLAIRVPGLTVPPERVQLAVAEIADNEVATEIGRSRQVPRRVPRAR